MFLDFIEVIGNIYRVWFRSEIKLKELQIDRTLSYGTLSFLNELTVVIIFYPKSIYDYVVKFLQVSENL